MNERPQFLPSNLRMRIAWGLGAAVAAAVFLGFWGHGALAWNTATYWLFVGAVFFLGAAMHGLVD